MLLPWDSVIVSWWNFEARFNEVSSRWDDMFDDGIRELWYMEVPSCTEWALNSAMNRFQPNTWVEVGKEGVEAKIKALSMYRGVMRPYPHPRSAEAIEGFAAYRGCQAGCNYAEAFEVVLRRL